MYDEYGDDWWGYMDESGWGMPGDDLSITPGVPDLTGTSSTNTPTDDNSNMNEDTSSDPNSPEGTGGFWEGLSNLFGDAFKNLAGTAATSLTTSGNNAIATATGTKTAAQLAAEADAAKKATQTKNMLLIGGAVVLAAYLIYRRRG